MLAPSTSWRSARRLSASRLKRSAASSLSIILSILGGIASALGMATDGKRVYARIAFAMGRTKGVFGGTSLLRRTGCLPRITRHSSITMEQRKTRNRLLRLVLPAWMACIGTASLAATPLADAARTAIDRLVQTQTAGLPGKATVTFNLAGSPLPPCDDFEAFMPTGTTLWGRVSIGLRCRGDKPWSRFISAQVVV